MGRAYQKTVVSCDRAFYTNPPSPGRGGICGLFYALTYYKIVDQRPGAGVALVGSDRAVDRGGRAGSLVYPHGDLLYHVLSQRYVRPVQLAAHGTPAAGRRVGACRKCEQYVKK